MKTAARIFTRSKSSLLLFFALLTGSACAPLVAVRTTRPKLSPQYGTAAERAIADGEKLAQSDPSRALGYYLSGVEASSVRLRKAGKDAVALRDYDFGLSRVFSATRDAHLDPWTRPLHVPAPNGGEYLLTNRANANRLWQPQDYELIPADELNVRGKFVVPRVTREGAGAALVAVELVADDREQPRL